MKIGLFSDAYLPEISGVTSVVSWLRRELERNGHEVHIYVPAYTEPPVSYTHLTLPTICSV